MCRKIWLHGEVRNNLLCKGVVQNISLEPWHKACVKEYGRQGH